MIRLAALRRDRRGNTLTEFGLIAPIIALVLMGLGDLLYRAYAQAMLDGAIQKGGRDLAIQGGAEQASTIDDRVKASVQQIAKGATGVVKRETYSSFTAMKPENFTDSNGNGTRDPNECFEDVNGNRTFDLNPARSGQGGADNVTMYTVTMTYRRLFPLWAILGGSDQQQIVSRTLIKNQPWTRQAAATAEAICPT